MGIRTRVERRKDRAGTAESERAGVGSAKRPAGRPRRSVRGTLLLGIAMLATGAGMATARQRRRR